MEPIDHELHFHVQDVILPERPRAVGNPERGFIVPRTSMFVAYNEIWEDDFSRDLAHRKHNRHFARKVNDFLIEAKNADKDMLIYVVLLIFLIIPYAAMVLCRKFCPQVLHGTAEISAKRQEEERLKKEAAAKQAQSEDKGIVEIDLTKKKKEREGKGTLNRFEQISQSTKALMKFSDKKPDHAQQKQLEDRNDKLASNDFKKNPSISVQKFHNKSNQLMTKTMKAVSSSLLVRFKNNQVQPADGKFLQKLTLIRNSPGGAGEGDLAKNRRNGRTELIQVSKVNSDCPSDADDEGDGGTVYYEVQPENQSCIKI